MSIKNLYNEEAREKIKEMAESIDMCMMSTDIDKKPFHSVVMSTKQVDSEGKIWFLSGKSSEHTKNIEKDGHTYLYLDKDVFDPLFKMTDTGEVDDWGSPVYASDFTYIWV